MGFIISYVITIIGCLIAYKIFNRESSDIIHKRTRVIELFEKTFEPISESEINDKQVAELILNRLENLPGSKNLLPLFSFFKYIIKTIFDNI